MSGTYIKLLWTVVVDDSENWTADHRAMMEKAAESSEYLWGEDWVQERLHAVMQEAGEKFIQAHPDLFRTGLV